MASFFFNDPAPTEIYPLPLHAALPIFRQRGEVQPPPAYGGDVMRVRTAVIGMFTLASLAGCGGYGGTGMYGGGGGVGGGGGPVAVHTDRESTRLNSSHGYISYGVFFF